LLIPLQHGNFYVGPKVHIKLNRLKKITTWIPLIPQLKNLHNFHVIIQALNTTSLHQHYKNINHNHNLQMSHILCHIKTKIQHVTIDVHKFINSSKVFIYFNPWCSWINEMYDIHMHLYSFNTITSDG